MAQPLVVKKDDDLDEEGARVRPPAPAPLAPLSYSSFFGGSSSAARYGSFRARLPSASLVSFGLGAFLCVRAGEGVV
jgi:hypothetical protein